MDLTELFIGPLPWAEGSKEKTVYSTRALFSLASFSRSFSHLFVHRMTEPQLEEQYERTLQEVKGLGLKESLSLKHCSEQERFCLEERFIFSPHLMEYPHSLGQKVIEKGHLMLSDDDSEIALINMKEQLTYLKTSSDFLQKGKGLGSIGEVHQKLEALKSLKDLEHGYLLADPLLSKAGLQLGSLLHLPGVHHGGYLETFVRSVKATGYEWVDLGAFSTHGGLFWLSSRGSAQESGFQDFAQDYKAICLKFLDIDREISETLYVKERLKVEDKAFRSKALLLYARRLTFNELLECISWIKWGVSLNLMDAKILEWLNILMVKTAPGHLSLGESKDFSEEKQAEVRAMTVRLTLEGLQ